MLCSKDSNQESSHHDNDANHASSHHDNYAILKLMASKVFVTRPLLYIRKKLNNLFFSAMELTIFYFENSKQYYSEIIDVTLHKLQFLEKKSIAPPTSIDLYSNDHENANYKGYIQRNLRYSKTYIYEILDSKLLASVKGLYLWNYYL